MTTVNLTTEMEQEFYKNEIGLRTLVGGGKPQRSCDCTTKHKELDGNPNMKRGDFIVAHRPKP